MCIHSLQAWQSELWTHAYMHCKPQLQTRPTDREGGEDMHMLRSECSLKHWEWLPSKYSWTSKSILSRGGFPHHPPLSLHIMDWLLQLLAALCTTESFGFVFVVLKLTPSPSRGAKRSSCIVALIGKESLGIPEGKGFSHTHTHTQNYQALSAEQCAGSNVYLLRSRLFSEVNHWSYFP